MKKAILSILMALLALAFYATDFILVDGTVILGTLKGISNEKMYVVDVLDQLHVLDFDQIAQIKDGAGDVSSIWKRKKAFMDINLDQYQQSTDSTGHTIIMNPSPYIPNTKQPLTQQEITNKHLSRISSALWTQNYFMMGSIVASIVSSIIIMNAYK